MLALLLTFFAEVSFGAAVQFLAASRTVPNLWTFRSSGTLSLRNRCDVVNILQIAGFAVTHLVV